MKKEVKIGLVAVAILLCTWAGLRFLSGVSIFGGNNLYYAYFENAGGLQSASPIMINGVKIGKVTDIHIDSKDVNRVVVELSVHHRYELPEDSSAKIFSNGLMGNKAIEVVYGKSKTVLENGAEIKVEASSDFMDIAGSEFEFFKTRITEMMNNINTTLTTINGVLEQNAAGVHGTVDNLNSMTGEMAKLMEHRRAELESAISNLNAFTAVLSTNGERMDSIVRNVNTFTGELAQNNTAENLSRSLDELNTMLAKINSGDGTVGKLVNDPVLYTNLAQASENLSTLLADLQQNPKRYVHFSLFGKSERKEAAKAQKQAEKAEAKAAKSK